LVAARAHATPREEGQGRERSGGRRLISVPEREQKGNENLKGKGALRGEQGARRATGGSVAHLSSREALQMIHKGRAVVATLVAAAPDHVRWKGYSPVSITKSMLPGRVVVLHICG